MRRNGWYGDSGRHALAARGISTKRKYSASKQMLMRKPVDPAFYAKREQSLPFMHLVTMVRQGKSYPEMQAMHPDADKEELRKRGIKAYEAVHATNALSTIDANGVDKNVELANKSKKLKQDMLEVLENSQSSTFIADVKANSLIDALKK